MLSVSSANDVTLPSAKGSELTQKLWGIDWGKVLPVPAAGTLVQAVDFDVAAAFMHRHYGEVFDLVPNSPFARDESSEARARYYRHAVDCFAFYAGSEPVALLLANAVDWSTYYIRSAAALPRYQGRLLLGFLPTLFDTLRAVGVERIETDASPTNSTTLQLALRLGFKATGTLTTDRWGALVRLTKFLAPEAERVFVDGHCAVRSGRKEP
jgi:hypothetical protein